MMKTNDGSTFIMYELNDPQSAEFLPLPRTSPQRSTSSSGEKGGSHESEGGLKKSLSTIPRQGDGWESEAAQEVEQFHLQMDPRYAIGQVFTLQLLGQCLGREYYVPSTLELMEALVMPARKGQPTFPFLVPVPDALVGKTFGVLFEKWTTSEEDCAVPLALYRTLYGSTGYVSANCEDSQTLRATDKVYVL